MTPEQARAQQADRNARNTLELVQVRRQLHHDRGTIMALREALAYGQAELDVNRLRVEAQSECDAFPDLICARTTLDLLDLLDSLPAILDRPEPTWTEPTDHHTDRSDQSATTSRAQGKR